LKKKPDEEERRKNMGYFSVRIGRDGWGGRKNGGGKVIGVGGKSSRGWCKERK